MNLQPIDWAILAALFALPLAAAWLSRKYIKGVADFLVAGRSVGRYLGLGSDSMQAMGAVTILAYWQMNYKAGFAGQWWYLLTPMAGILVALTGWGIYRFRETRAMTLGQLVGMRYGERARIFFGAIAYLAGVVNMGIFDLDALLHRAPGTKRRPWRLGPEVRRGDRVLIPAIYVLVGLFLLLHLAIGAYNWRYDIPVESWISFWPIYLYVMFGLGALFLIWITIGGFRDLFRLFRNLRVEVVDELDDGR